MKINRESKKLILKRTTISSLNNKDMIEIRGGLRANTIRPENHAADE